MRSVFEKLRNLVLVNGGFRGWDPFDAVRSVHGTPRLDESTKGVVWCEIGVIYQGLFGHGACRVFLREQPCFDAFTVVGDAC